MDKEQAKAAPASQDGKNASQGGLWQYEVPPQDPGAGSVQSNAGHYTGGAHGGDSQQGDFLASPPEANAMPPGAPQTSRGSARQGGADPQTQPMPGAGGGSGGAGLVPEPGGAGAGGSGAADDAGGTGGAGGGQPAPVGNGTPDQPVWAT